MPPPSVKMWLREAEMLLAVRQELPVQFWKSVQHRELVREREATTCCFFAVPSCIKQQIKKKGGQAKLTCIVTVTGKGERADADPIHVTGQVCSSKLCHFCFFFFPLFFQKPSGRPPSSCPVSCFAAPLSKQD